MLVPLQQSSLKKTVHLLPNFKKKTIWKESLGLVSSPRQWTFIFWLVKNLKKNKLCQLCSGGCILLMTSLKAYLYIRLTPSTRIPTPTQKVYLENSWSGRKEGTSGILIMWTIISSSQKAYKKFLSLGKAQLSLYCTIDCFFKLNKLQGSGRKFTFNLSMSEYVLAA